MRAMVLCAGFGTRLRPLTDRVPKPLVPLCGVPLLRYNFALLHNAGVREVVVNTHHLAAEMEKETAAHLRQTAATLPDEISVTTLLRHGDPAKEILAVAHERQVDVICLGARGRGRIAGALLGSVSSAVLRASPVPVVVWHPPREEREALLRPA